MSAPANATQPSLLERDRLGSIALDQWRGLALVMVLISHGFFFTDRVNGIGRVGVNLFFFISGILVFRSLSRAKAATDADRARSFWWRRLRRLYPALIAYTLAMLPVVWLLQHRPNLPPNSDFASYLKAMPPALVYVINYVEDHPLSLGHLWSLACEMQFYLLAPIIYIVGGTAEKRRLVVFSLVLAVLMGLGFAHPFIARQVFHSEFGKYHFEFAVWPMMLGFCCEFKREWFLRIPAVWVTVLLWSSAAICGAILCVTPFVPDIKPLVVATGALLLVPCLMACLAGRPMPGMFGVIMRWLGERTYSIYLWQQPLTLCNFLVPALHPLGSLASIALGGIWFQFFEKPFLSANRHK